MAFQYQSLATQLLEKIQNAELPAGQKLLSLRQFATLQKVSLNTAKSCYELLESQGYIHVKNKSGYFVSYQKKSSPSIPVPQHPDFQSQEREISNLELQLEIQQSSINSRLIHLGAIQLSPKHVPVEALRRSIQRALKHSQPEDFLYSDKQGHIRLRQALSEHWAEDGFYISQDDIYISNGCMPALSVIIQNLSQEGDSVIVPTPNFNGQLQMLAGLKRKIIEIPADTQGFDLERLEQVMQSSGAKACLLTANYQNPLGFCLSNAEKEKIAQLAARYQFFCGSVSKSLSTAYRVGWFCIPQRLAHLKATLLMQNITVNTPLQLALADLIYSRAYREHLQQLKPILKQQVEQYRHMIMHAFDGVELRINQPLGGYALWLQLPESIDGLDMYYFAQQHGINIVPGEVFGEGQRYKNCIRLNAGHELSVDIREAVSLLADWVKAQINRSVGVKQAV